MTLTMTGILPCLHGLSFVLVFLNDYYCDQYHDSSLRSASDITQPVQCWCFLSHRCWWLINSVQYHGQSALWSASHTCFVFFCKAICWFLPSEREKISFFQYAMVCVPFKGGGGKGRLFKLKRESFVPEKARDISLLHAMQCCLFFLSFFKILYIRVGDRGIYVYLLQCEVFDIVR